MRNLRLLYIATILIVLVSASRMCAQAELNGPTALIFSYRAHPGMRTQFRAVMAGEGVTQFESWKRAGIFSSYQALFTAYAGNSSPDLFVILHFDQFTDLGRWQQIERDHPGGLTARGQALADVDTSGTADVVQRRSSEAAGGKDAQYFILQYDVLVDAPKYVSYVKGYVAPQFEKWIDAGALASYDCYVNQNPAGAPWSSFIVLEYKDLKALASREIIKNQARTALAQSDPVWKKWSDDKTAIRKEKTAIPAINLAAAHL